QRFTGRAKFSYRRLLHRHHVFPRNRPPLHPRPRFLSSIANQFERRVGVYSGPVGAVSPSCSFHSHLSPKMKRSRSFRHYPSSPTTQGQSQLGQTELKAPGGTVRGGAVTTFSPVPPFVRHSISYVAA